MPRHLGVLRRGGRYYLNFRVPTDLRAAYGKRGIIRKSLGTSDSGGCQQSPLRGFEAFRLEAGFNENGRRLKRAQPDAGPRALCMHRLRDRSRNAPPDAPGPRP